MPKGREWQRSLEAARTQDRTRDRPRAPICYLGSFLFPPRVFWFFGRRSVALAPRSNKRDCQGELKRERVCGY
jgi:hypothetical protein